MWNDEHNASGWWLDIRCKIDNAHIFELSNANKYAFKWQYGSGNPRK